MSFRILAFGDSNTFGSRPSPKDGGPEERFGEGQRWPMLVQGLLGGEAEIIEAGLPGRTTDIDDQALPSDIGPSWNGATSLSVAIRSANPVDLVLIMLGTNDFKRSYGRSAADVAEAIGRLCDLVRAINSPTAYGPPAVLVLCPPPLNDCVVDGRFGPEFDGDSVVQSRLFAAALAHHPLAQLNLSEHLPTMDGEDGLHLTAEGHRAIARAVADKIRTLLPVTEKS